MEVQWTANKNVDWGTKIGINTSKDQLIENIKRKKDWVTERGSLQ